MLLFVLFSSLSPMFPMTLDGLGQVIVLQQYLAESKEKVKKLEGKPSSPHACLLFAHTLLHTCKHLLLLLYIFFIENLRLLEPTSK